MTDRLLRASVLLGVLLLPACQDSSVTDVQVPTTRAYSLLQGDQEVVWNFRVAPFSTDWSTGSSTAQGVSTSASVNASVSQTCGGPAEDFGGWIGPVHLTRFWGEVCYPFVTVTTASSIKLKSLAFFHGHNHNYGYPTMYGYNAQLQINFGAGWVNIGNRVPFNNTNNFKQDIVDLGNQAASGTFKLRWLPTNLAYGSDTSSEFFAMWDVTLTVASNNPTNADACKNNGWSQFGFRNQGLCVSFVNTGKDSR